MNNEPNITQILQQRVLRWEKEREELATQSNKLLDEAMAHDEEAAKLMEAAEAARQSRVGLMQRIDAVNEKIAAADTLLLAMHDEDMVKPEPVQELTPEPEPLPVVVPHSGRRLNHVGPNITIGPGMSAADVIRHTIPRLPPNVEFTIPSLFAVLRQTRINPKITPDALRTALTKEMKDPTFGIQVLGTEASPSGGRSIVVYGKA